MVVSLHGFHHASVSSQCVGFSKPISQVARQSLLNMHALIKTEINFIEMTPK